MWMQSSSKGAKQQVVEHYSRKQRCYSINAEGVLPSKNLVNPYWGIGCKLRV